MPDGAMGTIRDGMSWLILRHHDKVPRNIFTAFPYDRDRPTVWSPKRLTLEQAEHAAQALRDELCALEATAEAIFEPPPVEWIAARLSAIQELLERQTGRSALLLRRILGPVRLMPVRPEIGRPVLPSRDRPPSARATRGTGGRFELATTVEAGRPLGGASNALPRRCAAVVRQGQVGECVPGDVVPAASRRASDPRHGFPPASAFGSLPSIHAQAAGHSCSRAVPPCR